MRAATRGEIWLVLNEAFGSIRRAIQNGVPGATMEAGHHNNDAFWFRGYAEYSARERVVVISFNIQEKDGRLRVWGDIAQEDGNVLKDIMNAAIKLSPDVDQGLIETAKRFALECKKELALVETNLK